MKKLFLIILLTLCFASPSFAASKYVTQSGAGSMDGSDWSNAYAGLPSSLTRGDVYYIADGTYSAFTINTPVSGTSKITIRKASATDHGTETGWSSSYGDGQAVFNGQVVIAGLAGGYIEIDGQYEYGIKIYNTSGTNIDFAHYGSTPQSYTDVTFKYLELQGPGDENAYAYPSSYRGIDITAWAGTGFDAYTNVLVSHCLIHGTSTAIYFANVNNSTVEYCEIKNIRSSNSAVHENIQWIASNTHDITWRYNIVHNWQAEGIFLSCSGATAGVACGIDNIYIYGNVFYDPIVLARAVETRVGWPYGDIYIYNNTFVNFGYFAILESGEASYVVRNNIFATFTRNPIVLSGTGDTNTHNLFYSATPSGTSSQTVSTSPFVDETNKNYTLTAPTVPGYTLSSPYNYDMLGNLRGADGNWDRGAYEGGGIVEDNSAPTFPGPNTPSGTIACDAASPVNVTFTIGTNENATCTYSATDVAYASATVMSSTGGTTHTQTVALACNASYTYYFKCQDFAPAQNTNVSSNDLALSFTIQASAVEEEAPVMSNALPTTGSRYSCTANPLAITLGITATDESGVTGCQYALTDVAYGAEGGVALDTTGGTPVEDVDASYAQSNYSTAGLFIGYGAATTLSQSFESNGGTLNTAQFYLRKYAGATGNIVATLYAGDGTIGGGDDVGTGAVLATSDAVDISTLSSSSFQLVTFTFSGAERVTLTDGNHYVIGVYYTGVASTQVLYVGSDNTSPSHTGNTCYEDSGWTALSGYDLVFYVNVMRGGSGDYSKSVNFACGQEVTVYYRCTDGTYPNTTATSTVFTIYSPTPTNATEAESDTETSPMMAVSDVQASGGYYITSTTANSGSTTLTINVATAGTYRIGARVFASGSGTDSMFVTVNSEDECVWHFNPSEDSSYYNVWFNDYVNCQGTGTYAVPQYDPYRVALTSGNNTIQFRGREAGARVDYIWLDLDDTPLPPTIGTTYRIIGTGNTVIIGSGNTVIIE